MATVISFTLGYILYGSKFQFRFYPSTLDKANNSGSTCRFRL